MSNQGRHPKLSKAKARLLMEHPFFATLLIRTEITLRDDLPYRTAATDGDHIYFDPGFLDELSVEDTMTVLCHEVGHDSLLHSIRLGTRNHELWNMACDHAINLMLEDQGFRCPKAVSGGWLADPKYKGMSADRIYDDLRRNPPPKPKPQPGGGGEGKGKPGDQPGAPGKGDGSGKPGKGRDWLHGDVMPHKAPGNDPAAQAAAEQRAKQRVAAAATFARMAGKLKGELERMVGECLDSKVSWTDVLRDYMQNVFKGRENWARRNRRFRDIRLPSRYEKKMGPIVFIPDTSGSMGKDDLEATCSEIAAVAGQTQPENITVLWTDTRVASEQFFTPDEFSYDALRPAGGGGTDLRVGIQHAERYDPQVVIVMTDGYSPWAETAPAFPTIILCTTNTKLPDWAQTIRI